MNVWRSGFIEIKYKLGWGLRPSRISLVFQGSESCFRRVLGGGKPSHDDRCFHMSPEDSTPPCEAMGCWCETNEKEKTKVAANDDDGCGDQRRPSTIHHLHLAF